MAFFMPFTARHSSIPEAPLANLLRIVDNLNTFPGNSSNSGCRYAYRPSPVMRPVPRPWKPRFDARDTQDAYILRGELPGLNRDHVTIEFPEAQKIVISGKVVKEDATATPTNTLVANDAASEAASLDDETSSRSSYQATVEDGDDDDDFEVVGKSSKVQEKQSADAQLQADAKAAAATQKAQEERNHETARENIIRQFSRSFTFAEPVEYDFVTATLKDGLLEVVIPKVKHQPHQVVVN